MLYKCVPRLVHLTNRARLVVVSLVWTATLHRLVFRGYGDAGEAKDYAYEEVGGPLRRYTILLAEQLSTWTITCQVCDSVLADNPTYFLCFTDDTANAEEQVPSVLGTGCWTSTDSRAALDAALSKSGDSVCSVCEESVAWDSVSFCLGHVLAGCMHPCHPPLRT